MKSNQEIDKKNNQEEKILHSGNNRNLIQLRTSGESQIVFIKSLIFPMIDSYYVTLVYILTFVKNKGIDLDNFTKNV